MIGGQNCSSSFAPNISTRSVTRENVRRQKRFGIIDPYGFGRWGSAQRGIPSRVCTRQSQSLFKYAEASPGFLLPRPFSQTLRRSVTPPANCSINIASSPAGMAPTTLCNVDHLIETHIGRQDAYFGVNRFNPKNCRNTLSRIHFELTRPYKNINEKK